MQKKEITVKELENILYNFKKINRDIDEKREFLQEIEKYGMPKKSGSITSYTAAMYERLDDEDKKAEMVKKIRTEMDHTQDLLLRILEAIESIRYDEYFDIIRLRYFDRVAMLSIRDRLGISKSAVYRHKDRLVRNIFEQVCGNLRDKNIV